MNYNILFKIISIILFSSIIFFIWCLVLISQGCRKFYLSRIQQFFLQFPVYADGRFILLGTFTITVFIFCTGK